MQEATKAMPTKTATARAPERLAGALQQLQAQRLRKAQEENGRLQEELSTSHTRIQQVLFMFIRTMLCIIFTSEILSRNVCSVMHTVSATDCCFVFVFF